MLSGNRLSGFRKTRKFEGGKKRVEQKWRQEGGGGKNGYYEETVVHLLNIIDMASCTLSRLLLRKNLHSEFLEISGSVGNSVFENV